ncbi:hypothetical protein NMY22_g7868 [Coprinellus aureogranulatus]|nr:hypothetical protein NMY22_g7868 [Coprinellus aureogranulatus]
MVPSVGKLNASTQDSLRSTQILTSLPHIVSELTQNALDAGATLVEVGLDAKDWLCWVKDNGTGISKQNLDLIGQEGSGGRYSTSKVYAHNFMNAESTFGFRGEGQCRDHEFEQQLIVYREALASAAALACLEISSRVLHSKETWAVIVKGGKRLYFGPAVRWRRETPGTTVCIRDAFFNLPVRQKSHPSHEKAWDLTSSMLAAFKRLYGRALVKNVEEIRSSSDSLRIEGFISLVASNSKTHQHICRADINRHPMDPGELHRAIGAWFSQSTFGRSALNEDGEQDLPGAGIRRSPRKAEKRPVYCLNISIPPSDIDNCVEPGKSTILLKDQSSVLNLLSSTVNSFLRKHGFLRPAGPSIDHASTLLAKAGSPRKRRRSYSFDDSGFMEADVFGRLDASNHPSDIHRRESMSSELVVPANGESHPFDWTDPKTGETFIIDCQTGNSLNCTSHLKAAVGETMQIAHARGITDRRTMKRRGTDARIGSSDIPSWLSRALKMNNAFPVVEKRLGGMPVGLVSTLQLEPTIASQEGKGQCSEGSPSLSERISRQQLHHARVIGQVDRKFVGCLLELPSGTPSTTSESGYPTSLKAELSFLGPLCLGFLYSRSGGIDPGEAAPIIRFTPPCPVLLTRQEAKVLNENAGIRAFLQCWGISFHNSAKGSNSYSSIGSNADFEQVLVTTLPEVVSDKLRQNNELQALLRSTLGEIQSGALLLDNSYTPFSQLSKGSHSWLPALRSCPRSLVELINSKACRGAIMFNDELSMEQCERLISQLAQTAFPFQCAHGRPSLVPLTDVNAVASASVPRRLCEWTRLEQ